MKNSHTARRISVSGNRISSDGTWNYSYDNNGNVIEKEHATTGLVWDYQVRHGKPVLCKYSDTGFAEEKLRRKQQNWLNVFAGGKWKNVHGEGRLKSKYPNRAENHRQRVGNANPP